MRTKVFCVVNAGLFFMNGMNCLALDMPQSGEKVGFSSMPQHLKEQMRQHSGIFSSPAGILFTHLHEDHFDQRELRIIEGNGKLLIYGDDAGDGQHSFEEEEIDMAPFSVRAIPTTHDGATFSGLRHRSYVITREKENFFVAGDAILKRELAEHIKVNAEGQFNLAFCNIYQIHSAEGREFLRELNPHKIYLYHLPFQKDDTASFWKLARSAVAKYQKELPPLELAKPMTWLTDRR